AHDVHLRVALARGAARGVDLLEDHGGGPHGQPRAAILLGNQRGEKPALRQFGDEFGRIGLLRLQFAPIRPGIALADLAHRLAQLRIILAKRHRRSRVGHRALLFAVFLDKDSAEPRRIHPAQTARYSRRTISRSSSAEVAAAWLSKVTSPCYIGITRSQISRVCANRFRPHFNGFLRTGRTTSYRCGAINCDRRRRDRPASPEKNSSTRRFPRCSRVVSMLTPSK